MPAAMPMIIGLVRIPLTDFFKAAGRSPSDSGPVKERIKTAAML